ncbi:MAG: hypothetical protein LAT76_03930 [Schleiferiaceae bacterium]|nr:hypothetical protein [Schleiferiaceae bacterium]
MKNIYSNFCEITKMTYLILAFGLSLATVVFGQNRHRIHENLANDASLQLPDFYFSNIISEFELHNGEVIRGTVIRSVPESYYQVKLYNNRVIIILVSDVKSMIKVPSDIRERKFSIDYEFILSRNFQKRFLELGTGLSLGLGYDFGKDLKYSFRIDYNLGEHSTAGVEEIEREVIISYLFGYKMNRLSRISQVFYFGFSHSLINKELHPTFMATGRVELPIRLFKTGQLVPSFSAYQALNKSDRIRNGFFIYGLAYRFF